MTPPAHLSPIQFLQQPGGAIQLKNLPHLTLEPIEEQGTAIGLDWQRELGLPTYFEDWEAMARADGLSAHQVAFVLMDEAPTRLPGAPRLCPPQVTLPQTCPFELGHTGLSSVSATRGP